MTTYERYLFPRELGYLRRDDHKRDETVIKPFLGTQAFAQNEWTYNIYML